MKCVRFLIARKKLRTNIFQLKHRNFNSAICKITFTIWKRNISYDKDLQSAPALIVSPFLYIDSWGCLCFNKLYCPKFDSFCVHSTFFCSLIVFLGKKISVSSFKLPLLLTLWKYMTDHKDILIRKNEMLVTH